MPKKRELTLEFQVKVLSQSGFPLDLLKIRRFPTFLRQDTYGFQTSCKVQTVKVSAFKKKFEQYKAVTRVEKLYPADKDGLETLLIRGRWLRNGGVSRRSSSEDAAGTICLSDLLLAISTGRGPAIAGCNRR